MSVQDQGITAGGVTAQGAAKVYFADLRARNHHDSKMSKVARLFDAAGFGRLIRKNGLIAVKMHFGERGNDTFTSPVFARVVVDKIKEAGGCPFLTDTNTLYSGSRHNGVDHLLTAYEHGFSFATVNAPVIIADGLRSNAYEEVAIEGKHFKSVKIAQGIIEASGMIVLSHFKGHEMAGFGGAIKNLAMGCAPASGKKDQHAVRFMVDAQKCVCCGECQRVCPVGAAIVRKGEKAKINAERCIGCGECLTVCAPKAVDIDWSGGSGENVMHDFTERMVEYAHGAVVGKKNRVGYINFLMNITPDCDCVPWSDAPIVPDIGILASTDPVALDKACFDLVNQQTGFHSSHLSCNCEAGKDKFKGAWSHTTGEHQFTAAVELGMGTTSYELVNI